MHVLRVDRNNVVQDTLVQVGELVCVGGSVVCVWVGRVGGGSMVRMGNVVCVGGKGGEWVSVVCVWVVMM